MALPNLSSTTRTPWRDAPEPRAARLAAATRASHSAADRARDPARRAERRRRLLTRGLPALGGVSLVVALGAWVTNPGTMTPDEVASSAHEQVLRDVIRRTGDYSMTVGELDCVEITPGRGNCLADLRSKTHRADGLLVAVGYVVDPADGQLELVVKLP